MMRCSTTARVVSPLVPHSESDLSPALLLSGFPEVARRFPRTGPWAEVMKHSMAFLMLGVAAFFGARWIDALIGDQNVWWVIWAILLAMGAFIVVKAIKYKKTSLA